MFKLRKVMHITFLIAMSGLMMLGVALTLRCFAAPINDTVLVLDMRNAPGLPKNFRISLPVTGDGLNWTGFDDLRIMGSSQFSKGSFDRVINKYAIKKLTVFDLRQESHGFLNGNAVSWYGPHDAANAHKLPSDIEKIQTGLLDQLSKLNYATVRQILKKTDDERIIKSKPIEFSVHSVVSEQEFITGRHFNYFRFYVQDFHSPSRHEVDSFIKTVNQLPKNEWIYFHCRAGVGRTSTFMVMYDMYRNAKILSFADILARQVAIGGKDLSKIPPKNSYKYKFAIQRLNFIKKFYQYTRTNDDNFKTLFSEWEKNHKILDDGIKK